MMGNNKRENDEKSHIFCGTAFMYYLVQVASSWTDHRQKLLHCQYMIGTWLFGEHWIEQKMPSENAAKKACHWYKVWHLMYEAIVENCIFFSNVQSPVCRLYQSELASEHKTKVWRRKREKRNEHFTWSVWTMGRAWKGTEIKLSNAPQKNCHRFKQYEKEAKTKASLTKNSIEQE